MVKGISVCWLEDLVYYLPLRGMYAKDRWKLVAEGVTYTHTHTEHAYKRAHTTFTHIRTILRHTHPQPSHNSDTHTHTHIHTHSHSLTHSHLHTQCLATKKPPKLAVFSKKQFATCFCLMFEREDSCMIPT